MNPKVEEFINKMKKEKEFEEQNKREELLKSLGLIDDRGYSLEVTDEEYREILKYTTPKENTLEKTTKWSNVISAITLIVLIIGIVSGIIISIAIDSFIPIVYVGIYFVIYIPFMIGFSKIVEAAEKYLGK